MALDTDMSLLTSDGQVGYYMHSVRTRPEISQVRLLFPAEDPGSLWELPLVVIPTSSVPGNFPERGKFLSGTP